MATGKKNRALIIIRFVLWGAFVLAMIASVSHLAWAFGTLEFKDSQMTGWLAAIAVDFGLAALAYSIQQHKKTHRKSWNLWLGVVIFSVISAFANLIHAMAVEANGAIVIKTFSEVDPLALLKAVVLSASLPLLVVYLGEVVSSDDVQAAKESEKEDRKKGVTAENKDGGYTVIAPVVKELAAPELPSPEYDSELPPPQEASSYSDISQEDFDARMSAMNGSAPKSISAVMGAFHLSHATAQRRLAGYRKLKNG